jgi:hypothetical protein
MPIIVLCNIAHHMESSMSIKATTGNLPRQRTVLSPVSDDDHYKPEWVPVRPGSQDHENVPSRRVETREWRDGRVEQA